MPIAAFHEIPRTEASMNAHAIEGTAERRALLNEIGALADEIRELRRLDARDGRAQIAALTATMRLKWQEMRALRAPAAIADIALDGRGHYQ
jgi:hypothetical protein